MKTEFKQIHMELSDSALEDYRQKGWELIFFAQWSVEGMTYIFKR